MKTPPLVTVFITTHNRSELLQKAVNSVTSQTYSQLEIIIVNDGSKDDTQQKIEILQKSYKNILAIHNEKPNGAGAARNQVLKMASGKFITGLDDDDMFLPNRIEDFITSYEPEYSFLCSSTSDATKDGVYKSKHQKPIITRDMIGHKNYVGNHIFIETKRLTKTFGYDTTMSAWEDYELWFRLIQEYGSAKKINNHSYWVNKRHDLESITKSDNKGKGLSEFLDRHRNELSEDQIRSLNISDMRTRNANVKISDILKSIKTPKHSLQLLFLFIRLKIPFIKKIYLKTRKAS